jgi:hypothetical protein
MNTTDRHTSCELGDRRTGDLQDLELEVSGRFGRELGVFFYESSRLGFAVVVDPEQHNRG